MVVFKGAVILSYVVSAFCGTIATRQTDPQTQDINTPWPITYIALGDSFAAGIGAGKYVTPTDDEVKRCKRFDGSYPTQAKALLPHVDDGHFTFQACSGDVLGGIDAQITKVGGKRAHVITLSISGNDFKFSDVVSACVYNYLPTGDAAKEADCNAALKKSAAIIADEAIWNTYKQKVDKIFSDVAITKDWFNLKWTVLVITGYAKFFGVPDNNDACSKTRFPMPFALIPGQGNIMKANIRATMNTLVETVNQNIQSKIVASNPDRIRFVDIDSGFETHRFCEKGETKDPFGLKEQANNVWFTALGTALEETSFVPDSNSALEQEWNAWSSNLPKKTNGDNDLIPGLPNELQKTSVFHPKTAGHKSTASRVKDAVDLWAKQNGHNGAPPPQVCFGTDAPNIPNRIISIPGLIGPPQETVEPNGLIAKLREVVCSNQCKIPDNMDARAGAVATGDGGRCEISLGVQGGSEAYILRDRSISGTDQVQDCWDRTLALITTCVNNGANEGWRGGVDPNPAFYQAGYRKLNAGKHATISQDHLLQKDLSNFQSVCGKGDGPCQGNGCQGVWYICQAGDYKGCYCGRDSRFSMLPGPDHKLQCHTDCCNTVTNNWYTNDWCAANCGGVSSQFC
ncbi:SGNH hydrolase-type esterase domain-containing protein [Tricladium varicosporioides]|nr:SGNH hydrolase-type esterase domain-containing protein [Hymenoscyphus varicosporioides]